MSSPATIIVISTTRVFNHLYREFGKRSLDNYKCVTPTSPWYVLEGLLIDRVIIHCNRSHISDELYDAIINRSLVLGFQVLWEDYR